MHLYHAELHHLPPLAELEACASPERLAAARALRDPTARLRSLGAGYLLFQAFGRQHYAHTPTGKPFLPGGPHFSLSHSHERILLVVSDTPCGCDIEFHRPNRNFAALAHRHFHPTTAAEFLRLGPTPSHFYPLWTLGEALIKATGLGIARLPPRSLPLSSTPPYSSFPHYTLSSHSELPNYSYAIALYTP